MLAAGLGLGQRPSQRGMQMVHSGIRDEQCGLVDTRARLRAAATPDVQGTTLISGPPRDTKLAMRSARFLR